MNEPITLNSKYCIEHKNESTLGEHPCRCYKKTLIICYRFKVYEVNVCRHWLKYINDMNFRKKNYSYSFYINPFQLIINEIDPNNEIFFVDTYTYNLRKQLSYFYIKYPHFHEIETYSKETVRKKLNNYPYFEEIIHISKSKCVAHKIHISDVIQYFSYKHENLLDFETEIGKGYLPYYSDDYSHENIDINIQNLYEFGTLIKAYLNNDDSKIPKIGSLRLTTRHFISFASKYLINNYKKQLV